MPYTSRKLRNDLLKLRPTLKIDLRVSKVNGAVFGCSGFVTDPSNGAVVYVSTDHNHGTMYDKALYRTAKNTRDFTGGVNNTCTYADLAQNVIALLDSTARRSSATGAAPSAPPRPVPDKVS